MARKTFSQEARAKGYKALLRSTSKKAEGLKEYARKWLREHGYSASIVLLALICLAAPAMAQRSNVVYVDAFRDRAANVGAMATLAQSSNCSADTSLPCVLIFDSVLAAFPQGVLPTPCTQCTFISYMTAGTIKIASNASPTLVSLSSGASGTKTEFSVVAAATGNGTAGTTYLLNAQSVPSAEWVAGAIFVFVSNSKWVNSDSTLAKVAGFGVAIDGTVRGSCNAASVTTGLTAQGFERLTVTILTAGAGGTALLVSECNVSGTGVGGAISTTTISIDTTAAHSIAASVGQPATDNPSTATNFYFNGTRTN